MHPRVPRSTKRTVEGLPKEPFKVQACWAFQEFSGCSKGRPVIPGDCSRGLTGRLRKIELGPDATVTPVKGRVIVLGLDATVLPAEEKVMLGLDATVPPSERKNDCAGPRYLYPAS